MTEGMPWTSAGKLEKRASFLNHRELRTQQQPENKRRNPLRRRIDYNANLKVTKTTPTCEMMTEKKQKRTQPAEKCVTIRTRATVEGYCWIHFVESGGKLLQGAKSRKQFELMLTPFESFHRTGVSGFTETGLESIPEER